MSEENQNTFDEQQQQMYQQNQKEPDFVFVMQIPVNIPTQEEVAIISPHLENYIQQLVTANHLTHEEAVAFVKFSSELGSFTPFMMDAFLQSYRKNTSEVDPNVQEVRKNAEIARGNSNIIT